MDRGARDSAADAAVRCNTLAAGLGRELHPARASRQRDVVLGATRAPVPRASHVEGGDVDGPRQSAPRTEPPGEAVCRRRQLRWSAGAGECTRYTLRPRPRCQVRRHTVAHTRRDLQHRLFAGRSGPGTGQPDAVLAALSRTPGILHRELPSSTRGRSGSPPTVDRSPSWVAPA